MNATPPAPPETTLREQRADFGLWLRAATPGWRWDWPHLAHVRRRLFDVSAGRCKRLALFLPPQHGKTEMVTVRYPVWRLERDPTLRVALAGYNQRHSNRFSRKARRIAQARGLPLSRERQAVEEWETTVGGGLRAVGVGSGITGNPVDLLVIDDPLKSREEAESEVYRERLKEWYADDLYTRLQPAAAIILIQTRWHEDDLGGWILGGPDAGNWVVVSLPAEAEDNDPLGRSAGEALCPERFDLAELADRRRVLGTAYYALYQQRPVPRGGNLVKLEWLPLVADSPCDARRVRYWDKAGTEGGGAYSCGVRMAKGERGVYHVEDVVRGQWSAGSRERVIRETAERDRAECGHVATWAEQEPGSGGKESAENTVRNLAGYDVHVERVTGDKVTRFLPFAAQAEAGNVRVLRRDWTADYRNELIAFPRAKYADQADATSGAFNKLAPLPADRDPRSMLPLPGTGTLVPLGGRV